MHKCESFIFEALANLNQLARRHTDACLSIQMNTQTNTQVKTGIQI